MNEAEQKAQDKALKSIMYLMMQLISGNYTGTVENQIGAMRAYFMDYDQIPIHTADQAERVFLQEILKMLRDFSIELWLDDEHRLMVLEEVRTLLSRYTGLPPYTPFTRDKFYV